MLREANALAGLSMENQPGISARNNSQEYQPGISDGLIPCAGTATAGLAAIAIAS